VNNFLYDVSEIPIPMDSVDRDFIDRPRHWDMSFIRNFMLVVGPVSSIFDFLTFFVMLRVFHAGEPCSTPAGSSSRSPRRCWPSS